MLLHPAGAPRGGPSGLRFPAFLWALLHVPVFLALYATSIGQAVQATPAPYRAWLWPTFVPQALLLALVAFALALPFSLAPRAYRFAVGAAAGLLTGGLAVDAKVLQSVGFHLNGFFLRVMLQPNALRETGVPLSDVLLFLGGALALVAVDVLAGAWFVRRFAAPARRAWPWALALLLLSAAERVYGGGLTYFAGSSVFAASTTLPLQVPIRMQGLARSVFGDRTNDPFEGANASKRLPAGVDPAELRFEHRPDVLFVVAESLPAEHLDARTMPRLWARAEHGARFTRHYAAASSTNYTLFSLVYGLQAQKLEAVVGAGRQPTLFPALTENGYQVKVSAASCVDWMDLQKTVFGGVSDLETWCDGNDPSTRDAQMLKSARAFTARADPARPVFLFLFFFGTHFNYFHDPEDQVFAPAWDGAGGLKATRAPGVEIEHRARNAAHALDRALDAFLDDFTRTRGREPLVVFTGDHGEEFRQKGHLGHGSAVTDEQIHVPAVWLGPGVPAGVRDAVTSHVDVVPTLFSLLGERHPASLYADGLSMFEAPEDRFVVSTVGWEPRYAAIGKDLKVTMYAGMGGAQITDPDDRPLPDGPARMARQAGRILRALRGEAEPAPRAAAAPAP
ncbi:sulfatase [Anaeromyxobacter dehalogenans 2CP-1]|uniref:Sulfatase n=1 Tax=Anaeromyxobacter dehalogenans (strain ATCC BAA-258 / DSM 21875 / 2CP-1) TaxID=455488 RepID=B8J8V5_ANAD2|nr:sulfatase-like hydrolase/transferase [Anaeromyxobacter dehalogenans]ACL63553.1 sulfatase [Anaeromyxobacter dehalogenans 2CP-1]